MSEIILAENHYSLSVTEEVETICKQFFTKTPINHACYIRLYHDGSISLLVPDVKTAKFHFEKKHPITPIINEKSMSKNFNHIAFPLSTDKYSQTLHDYKNIFNIHYPIFFFEKNDGYLELFILYSNEDNPNVINYYINNMEILGHFKLYFRDKALKLINKSSKNRILLPAEMKSNIFSFKKPIADNSFDLLLNIKKYHLKTSKGNFSITKREMEVIKNIARGRTIKEAAKIMSISPRTAEHYFNNAKTKFGLTQKSQVLDLMSENCFFYTQSE